jgi:hypothetical protein
MVLFLVGLMGTIVEKRGVSIVRESGDRGFNALFGPSGSLSLAGKRVPEIGDGSELLPRAAKTPL